MKQANQTNNKTRDQPPTVFKLNADGVQIKCRTRPPQFDEIHLMARWGVTRYEFSHRVVRYDVADFAAAIQKAAVRR